jgi:hypothetical protein
VWISSVAYRVLSCEQTSGTRLPTAIGEEISADIVDDMPKENANPDAILDALKKIDIVSELLEDKNKNNLKMIAEGKVSGGKQIGPYARLLTYSPGEEIMREGEWGGNTFYFSVEGDRGLWEAGGAAVYVSGNAAHAADKRRAWRILYGDGLAHDGTAEPEVGEPFKSVRHH